MDVLNFFHVQYFVNNFFFQTKQEVYLFPGMSHGFVFSPVCDAACFLSHTNSEENENQPDRKLLSRER